MSAITWVHDEMLSPDWIRSGQPAVFVFDEEWIRAECLSLKRIVFMYECLSEMPGVEVHKGRVVEEVSRFARKHHAARIETAQSPSPRLLRQGKELGVTWIDPEPIATIPGEIDLKRFSRYWRRAEKQVLRAE